jgi:hypothetical protein
MTGDLVRREDREPFITADGSEIRELAGVPSANAANQSLAEATVPAGGGEPLILLCCCAPAYSHEDTVLLEDRG